MEGIRSDQTGQVLRDLVQAVRENKQHLSELDGAIGDGDHGVNLNKGFSLWAEELQAGPGELSSALAALSRILLASIGGAMGPLYGMVFRGLAAGCKGQDRIDAAVFGRMLAGAVASVQTVSQAKVGDKTLMDVLLPAEEAFRRAAQKGRSFAEALEALAAAAEAGRESTRELVARVGRASRLGERSRGSLDPGAASCALILTTLAGSLRRLLSGQERG
jgi:dihydroxyacetone kinase-like protein